MFFDPDSDRTQVWSCGGGTQSTAIAVLILQGKLPKPDLAVMVDTERESSDVWTYIDAYTRPALAKIGLPIHIVPTSTWANYDLFGGTDETTVLMPGFTTQGGKVGKLRNFCTDHWKRNVKDRWLRSQGVKQCDSWVGFSLDELSRIKTDRRQWNRSLYPLIHLRMRRQASIELVRAYGWPDPPRSACWMCPNKQDSEWLEMKRDRPGDFAKAVELERDVQQTDPHFWLHQSCVPLDQVVFKVNLLPLFDDMGCSSGMCGI